MDTSVKHVLPPTVRRIKAEIRIDRLWPVMLILPLGALPALGYLNKEHVPFAVVLHILVGAFIAAQRANGSYLVSRLRPLSDPEFKAVVEASVQNLPIKRYLAAVAAQDRPLFAEDLRYLQRLHFAAQLAAKAAADASAQASQRQALREIDDGSARTGSR